MKFEGSGYYQYCRLKLKEVTSSLHSDWLRLLNSTAPEDVELRDKCIQLGKIEPVTKRRSKCEVIDGYFLFAAEYRQPIASLFPEWGSRRITLELIHQWRHLPDEFKEPYISEGKMRRYNRRGNKVITRSSPSFGSSRPA